MVPVLITTHKWLSHKPSGSMPVLSTSLVTFPATEHNDDNNNNNNNNTQICIAHYCHSFRGAGRKPSYSPLYAMLNKRVLSLDTNVARESLSRMDAWREFMMKVQHSWKLVCRLYPVLSYTIWWPRHFSMNDIRRVITWHWNIWELNP